MQIGQLLGWVQVAQIAAAAGIATAQTVAGWIRSVHGTQMTEEELNAVIDLVLSDAGRRKTLADADVAAADVTIASDAATKAAEIAKANSSH